MAWGWSPFPKAGIEEVWGEWEGSQGGITGDGQPLGFQFPLVLWEPQCLWSVWNHPRLGPNSI